MFDWKQHIIDLFIYVLQVCNGPKNATHMECWVPAFPEEIPDNSFETGEISIHMDGKRDLWKRRFHYHPNAKVIPFESDDNKLLLKHGETEVSLHVCSHTSAYWC